MSKRVCVAFFYSSISAVWSLDS